MSPHKASSLELNHLGDKCKEITEKKLKKSSKHGIYIQLFSFETTVKHGPEKNPPVMMASWRYSLHILEGPEKFYPSNSGEALMKNSHSLRLCSCRAVVVEFAHQFPCFQSSPLEPLPPPGPPAKRQISQGHQVQPEFTV